MIYLPCHMLRPGMILARALPSNNPLLPLLAAKMELTVASINKIQLCGVQGAYIENQFSDGIDPEDVVEPELKQKLLSTIQKEFDGCLKKPGMLSSTPDYKSVSAMSDTILMTLLNKDKLLFQIIDIRDYDNYTCTHSLNVGLLAVMLGMRLNLSRPALSQLAMCGLLHDVGKLEVPLSITNKPGPLTEEEFELMQNHPTYGAKRLNNSIYPAVVIQAIRHHHEKFDGTGYPDHLSGENIPLFSRILAIADVFDALSAARPYRPAWSADRIIDYITSISGTHFDPDLLPEFLQFISAYPAGSVVRLSDGSAGIVVDNVPGFALRPKVRLIYPVDRQGEFLDMSCDCLSITVTGIVNDLKELSNILPS